MRDCGIVQHTQVVATVRQAVEENPKGEANRGVDVDVIMERIESDQREGKSN